MRKVEYADGCTEFTVGVNRPFEGHSLDKDSTAYKVKKRREERHGKCPFDCSGGSMEDNPFTGEREYMWHRLSDEAISAKKERSERESVRRARKAVEAIGRCNKWDYFLTLTFADDEPGHDYQTASLLFMKWTHALKARYPQAEWLLVMEQGSQGHRWHAHALLRGCELRLVDSGHKVKKTKQTIYNIPLEWPHGFATVTHVRSTGAAGLYMSKYIGKALGAVPAGHKRYWASKSLTRLEDVSIKYLLDGAELRDWLAAAVECASCVRRVHLDTIGMDIMYIKFYEVNEDDESGSRGINQGVRQ